jgi:hypothetical protein
MYFSPKSKTSILLAAIIVAAGTLVQVSAYTGGEISIKLKGGYVTFYRRYPFTFVNPI